MPISAPSDCSPSVQDGASMLHIAAVERETGIAKDTLRVWEKRYGFPQPLRDATGDRVYAASQVARLRKIRQLLDAGMRPGKVVGLGAEALARLLAETSVNDLSDLSRTKNTVAPPAQSVSDFLDLIAGHSPQALRHALAHAQLRMGVAPFVTELLAPLNQAVGEAWVQGRFKVFEEHFYTEVIGSLLRETIASLAPLASARRPKVLLTTLPPEQHGLGLLMVEALLALEGCCCVSLGTQTPLEDLAHAAHAHHVDLIALSFSSVHPESLVLDNLQALRNQLPQPLGLWVGGACPALYRHPIAGVVPVGLLTNIPGAVARWRRRETETLNARNTRT